MQNQSGVEGSTEYRIVEAAISSDRTADEVDVRFLISDFQIYESIFNPYLTADITFIDQENIVQDLDLQGGEKLTLGIVHIEEVQNENVITKEFLIDEISNVFKADERNEVVQLHAIEYHAFESSVQNVNKSYIGSPSTMIKRIAREFLNKDVLIDGVDGINDMKLIVPNMHPKEARHWIKGRTLTGEGLPFYYFSALGVENLVLKDLGTMLEQNPINANTPYVYAPSMNMSLSTGSFYNILSFDYEGTENLIGMIREGIVGAQYQFHDTLTGIPETMHFDVDANVFRRMANANKIGVNNSKYNYAPEYKVKDKRLHDYDSKVISQLASSGAYQTSGTVFKSFQDEEVGGSQRKKIVSKAIQGFLGKSPINITVRGRDFITGDGNYTIGKVVRIVFLDTNPIVDQANSAKIDKKKSGDYIIMLAKHNFRLEKFDTTLTCAKIASVGDEMEL